MGLYQSFPQVFVTNTSALLASGKTVDSLAVGQIGILDAKTYKATVAPTYATNKAIYVVWGTPDINAGDFGGVPNENEYTKLIKGKLVKRFRAKKAQRGQTPVYTVGWSGGVSDTDSLTARPGQSKNLYIKLTGRVIDRLYSTQGLTKVFKTTPKPIADCDADCVSVQCPAMAKELADQIMADRDFKKFIKAKAIIECDPAITPPVTQSCYEFLLTTCDTGDGSSLGKVQAQYPDEDVTFVSRRDALSTYHVVKDADAAPADFTSTDVFVANCASCPTGYTFTAKAKVFEVRTQEGVAAGTVNGVFTGETTTTLISSGPQFNIYNVTFATTADNATIIAAGVAAGYDVAFIGVQSGLCTQTAPTTVAWSDGTDTLLKEEKKYRLTLGDDICGDNRLAALQAAYPDLVVSVVSASGTCVHTYETTKLSNCYVTGCAIEAVTFEAPPSFEGAIWTPVVVEPAADATCKCGLQLETAFFNVNTNDCTFDAFPYENDVVHIQASDYDPDFNSTPDETSWSFKQIRQVQYPQGHGAYVQRLEKDSKAYDQRHRSWDPVVREVQGYELQARAGQYYDQYVLEFDTKWKTSGGWAEDYTQSFHLTLFVPEGQGTEIEKAFNSYVSSSGIEEEGAVV